MNFFTCVEYKSTADIDKSFYAKSETIADVLRAPGRWFASEAWDGGKKVTIERSSVGKIKTTP